MRKLPLACILLQGSLLSLRAVTIDFEGLPDLSPVTTQYVLAGVIFEQATVLTAGLSLNEFDFPPHSGTNAVIDDGGSISGQFVTPVSAFAAYFTYNARLRLLAFDSQGREIGAVQSQFDSNVVGHPTNELLAISSSSLISSFVISGALGGSSYVMDDFNFSVSSTPQAVGDFDPSTAVTFAVTLCFLHLSAAARSRFRVLRVS